MRAWLDGGRVWGREGGFYRIQVAVTFAHCIERLHPVIGVQVEQEAFELRHLTVTSPVDFCEPVNTSYAIFDQLQLLRRHAIAFIDDDDVGVGDLQMRGRHVQVLMLCIIVPLHRLLVQTQKDVLGINKSDDSIQIDCAPQAIVDPK